MEIQRSWMSADTGRKSRYAAHMLGGIGAIAALLVLLTAGGTLAGFWLGLPREIYSLLLCLGVTVLGTFLALRLGNRAVAHSTLFFLTVSDRLFALDARRPEGQHPTPFRLTDSAVQTQKRLRQLARQPVVPMDADEILQVERIRENQDCYAVRCWVSRGGRRPVRRVYFVHKSLEQLDLLLQELERRTSWQLQLEPVSSHTSLGIAISALALAGFAALCTGSHPALGRLPQEIYFPCLAAAFAAFASLVVFLVRRRRGE